MGDTSGIEILGKSLLDWVKLSLDGCDADIADFDADKELPALVKPHIKQGCDYIVVLFSDYYKKDGCRRGGRGVQQL